MSDRIDFETLIAEFDAINRHRSLTEEEVDRLVDLIDRQRNAEIHRKRRAASTEARRLKAMTAVQRYREKNREMLNQKRVQYSKDNPEQHRLTARAYREANPQKNAEACRRYRQKLKTSAQT